MANSTDSPQKQLLSLIRDFATEKSQGERRVSDLKRKLTDLQTSSDSANADLERAKQTKETAEQEVRGLQVKLSMTESSIAALEGRICNLQAEITRVGSKLSWIKHEASGERDYFLKTMYEINGKIRKLLEMQGHISREPHFRDLSSGNEKNTINKGKLLEIQGTIRGLNNKIAETTDQMHIIEGECCMEHNLDEVLQDAANIKRRGFLIEAVIQETQELQQLSGQTSEWEKQHASLAEELRMKFVCPHCQFNNMGGFEGNASIE